VKRVRVTRGKFTRKELQALVPLPGVTNVFRRYAGTTPARVKQRMRVACEVTGSRA